MSTLERVSAVDFPVAERPATQRSTVGTHRALVASAAAVVVVSAIAVDPHGLRPFTSLRWFLVGSLVAAAGLAASRSQLRPQAARLALPRWFLVAGGVVIGSMALSALLVGEAATAWLGHPQRHLGVVAWVVFGAAALSGAVIGRASAGAVAIPVAAVLAAAATGLTATADLLGWSPLGTDFAGGRIGGLFGQPTTLAAFAVLLLPLTVIAPVPARVRLLTVTGLVVAVVGTQTRGALVGLAVAAAVSLPAVARTRRPRWWWGLAAGAGALVLTVTPVGDRLRSSAESSRVDEWRLAAEVIGDHPLLGVGPEGYRLAVIDALDPAYADAHGRDVVIDRAHSAPLDVAASGGLAAGVAYLVLVGGVATATWRLQRRAPWSMPAAAGTGAVGFLAAGLLAFPTPEVDAVAWLFAGIAVAAVSPAPSGRSASRGGRRTAVVVAGALIAVSVVAGTTDVVADRWLEQAREHRDQGRTADAMSTADRATGLRPDLVDGWYVAARVAAAGPTILDLDAGIDRAVEGLRRSPRDPALRSLHAALVTERALRTGLDRDRSAAVHTLDELIADDPTNEHALALRAQLRRSDGKRSPRAEMEPVAGTRRV